jgi:rhodanese-related sulfurtransferase
MPGHCQSCRWQRGGGADDAVDVTHESSPAVAHFASRLRWATDPSDVAAARAAGEPVVVVDVRDRVAWDQGHVPGAVHLPRGDTSAGPGVLPPPADDPDLVVYCWGPGCNGSTKAALSLALAGYGRVREMIGGLEYWAREGLAVQTAAGRTRRPVDELTAPLVAGPPPGRDSGGVRGIQPGG